MSEANAVGDPTTSRWVELPPDCQRGPLEQLAPGFVAGTASAGLKGEADDVAVIASERPVACSAILLTSNGAAAAPVRVCGEACDANAISAAVVNSGNANAATGPAGYDAALEVRAVAAGAVGIHEREVAIAQTGVIGVELPTERVCDAARAAAASRSGGRALDVAQAIMTTDAGPKLCSLSAGGVTLTAQAKGAGMIDPRFATMLCFVQTDGVLDDPAARLRAAAEASFERISVDGQQSTNDTVLLQSSGESGLPVPDGLLEAALLGLAIAIVADGEGATRVARIEVEQARDEAEAEAVASAIARSPLVKTALYGRDPNWGRIVQAAGMALAGEDLSALNADSVDADELGGDRDEVEIAIRLGRGDASGYAYFSDLNAEYVRVNADYTT